jgi:hypothetical protein
MIATTLVVLLPPAEAFESVLADLRDAISRGESALELDPQGRSIQRGEKVGVITEWEPGSRFVLEWHPATATTIGGVNPSPGRYGSSTTSF